jgi:hypothetical protein
MPAADNEWARKNGQLGILAEPLGSGELLMSLMFFSWKGCSLGTEKDISAAKFSE